MMKNLAILLGKSFNPANGFFEFPYHFHRGDPLCGVFFQHDRIRAGGVQLEVPQTIFQFYYGDYDDSGTDNHDRILPDGLPDTYD